MIAATRFRIGHLQFAAHVPDARDREVLTALVRQPAVPETSIDGPTGTLVMTDAPETSSWPVAADGLAVHATPADCTVTTEAIRGVITPVGAAWSITLQVRTRTFSADAFRTHVSVVVHRLLLDAGCAYLHAAAVEFDNRVLVFVGEKGAGKSTLSLTLARAGAVVLGDDHVLIERAAPAYHVSGCEPTSRVAADTEASLFPTPLPGDRRDYAGTLKKEFAIADYFAAAPYIAKSMTALYFPRVGDHLAVTPLSPQGALVDLVERTRPSFRPQNADEIDQLLAFWSGLVRTAPAHRLTLPRDLAELAHLATVLRA